MSRFLSELLLLTLCALLLPYVRLDININMPYPKGGHHDIKRTYRYVRDCQHITHGNRLHESIKPSQPVNYHDTAYIKFHSHYGHQTIVKNPLAMIKVLEPGESGGCKKRLLSTVPVTAEKSDCLVAINAGFFNPEKNDIDHGRCYGNIISNGRMVQDSNGVQNAHFGIRQDGTVVIGYLSEEEVLDKKNPFVQLVGGVGWVLRNGEVYLDESAKAECRETETTGTLTKFFNIRAARTLIGFDVHGYVHLVQFDGKTWETGVNLQEAADYMKSIGIINAINFDGGGSSTYVIGSTVVNYPSEMCENSTTFLCPRNVSTVICVHSGLKGYDSVDSLVRCCNRNYLIVVGMSAVIAIIILLNVYIFAFYMSYRSRFLVLSGAHQKKEALKSLLDQNGRYSTGDDDESDEDEI